MLIAVDGTLSVNQESVTMATVALFTSMTPCSSSTLLVIWQALVIKNVGNVGNPGLCRDVYTVCC